MVERREKSDQAEKERMEKLKAVIISMRTFGSSKLFEPIYEKPEKKKTEAKTVGSKSGKNRSLPGGSGIVGTGTGSSGSLRTSGSGTRSLKSSASSSSFMTVARGSQSDNRKSSSSSTNSLKRGSGRQVPGGGDNNNMDGNKNKKRNLLSKTKSERDASFPSIS